MADDSKKELTHIDDQGRAHMVDVSAKPIVRRLARAEAMYCASVRTIDVLLTPARAQELPKGEALAVARVAGIQAAKRTGELIPLCHPLPIDHAEIAFERAGEDRIRVTASVTTTARTGVEMEALTAATIAAMTLYDMTKAIDSEMRIEGVRLVEKVKEG